MTGRTVDDARRWMRAATQAFLDAAGSIHDEEWNAASELPGWTRKHVVAHVAANADAIGNLVHWAATAERTPMYSSPAERAEGIATGTRMAAGELLAWLDGSARRLEAAMRALTGEQWDREVVTAQGRTVRATETPWLRSRELWVHLTDLATGITFADLPRDFLTALRADITAQRGAVPEVLGTPGDITAYLAGRRHGSVTLADGRPAPELGPWL